MAEGRCALRYVGLHTFGGVYALPHHSIFSHPRAYTRCHTRYRARLPPPHTYHCSARGGFSFGRPSGARAVARADVAVAGRAGRVPGLHDLIHCRSPVPVPHPYPTILVLPVGWRVGLLAGTSRYRAHIGVGVCRVVAAGAVAASPIFAS